MKLLLDFLPIILFFVSFKWAEGHKELVAQWMTQYLGFMVAGGVVGQTEAPVLLSTVLVAALSILQIVVLKLMRKKVETMLWISLAVVLVLGGLTVYFHSETFIKWKPTAIYWAMGGGLLISDIIMKRGLLRKMMSASQINVPGPVWTRLSWSWILFFVAMGFLNLYVAFNFSTSTWVDFKMWGGLGLMLVFTVAQGIYLSRHMDAAEAAKATEAAAEVTAKEIGNAQG
ncbi:MAG: septation protein A [Rubrivivax sp.]|nr:MAG: septation protein A [Rubrivivax sp.]